MILEVAQFLATCFLGIVAVLQARAANSQAETAREQAAAAKTQADAARARLEASLSPRLVPISFQLVTGGGKLTLLNQGKGTAYAIQWRFDKDHYGADGEDAVPNGDGTEVDIISPNLDRELIVTYHDKSGAEFTTRLRPTVEDPDQRLAYSFREPEALQLIARLRATQRGRDRKPRARPFEPHDAEAGVLSNTGTTELPSSRQPRAQSASAFPDRRHARSANSGPRRPERSPAFP